VANDFTAKVWVIGSVDRTLYVMTDDSAERLRICSVDLDNDDPTDRSNWREIVAESDDTITEAHVYADLLFVHYLHDAHSQIHVFDLDGNALRRVELPGIVSVVEMSGDDHTPLVHLAVSSFTEPTSIWQHNRETAQTTLLAAAQCRLASNDLVTEQVFVTSYDGTRLPVFLVHRRDVVPSGDVPVFLYGYGGFNIAMTPSFMPARALWAERGGLYAVAVLRGGGEYGKAWHDAGRLANKQNVFEDFCAVAQWLGGESGWSRPSRVAIHGGSNGGLLVGACLTQRPELFGAATPAVGVLDMLRFHKFTIGWAWASDYGSPDDAEDFAQLLSYSPLHNIKPGATYPPTLVITGDHDDRVAPGHSFKFAAALQAAQAGDAPVLIRVETSVGHGAGKPTQKAIDEATDLLAFLEHNLLS
jgi:prolyl oligopeptidase